MTFVPGHSTPISSLFQNRDVLRAGMFSDYLSNCILIYLLSQAGSSIFPLQSDRPMSTSFGRFLQCTMSRRPI